MKLILYQATIAITEIDFVPGPFRFQIELGHLDFAAGAASGEKLELLGTATCKVAKAPSLLGAKLASRTPTSACTKDVAIDS